MKVASSAWFHTCSVGLLEIQFIGAILFKVVQESSMSPQCPFSALVFFECRAGSL